MIDVKKHDNSAKNHNQFCVNEDCKAMFVYDGNFQETVDTNGNEVVLKGITVIKIDKKTQRMVAKCKKCKTWNPIKFRANLRNDENAATDKQD